jgi:hypothetical protein
MQSYDNILKVVSVAYGKNETAEKQETTTNQWIMKNCPQCPMETVMNVHF